MCNSGFKTSQAFQEAIFSLPIPLTQIPSLTVNFPAVLITVAMVVLQTSSAVTAPPAFKARMDYSTKVKSLSLDRVLSSLNAFK